MNDILDRFIVLHGTDSTLVLEVSPIRAPIWRYWGTKLPADTLPHSILDDERAVPTFALDTNVPATIFPSFGVGWYGATALLAHSSGRSFAQDFSRSSYIWLREHEAVLISLFDDVAQLQVDIRLDLTAASDTLTCKTTLTNLGPTKIDVTWLAAACLPIPAAAHSVRYYTGRHNQEFELYEDVLSRATWSRENRRGMTSHDCVPGGVVTLPQTTQHIGPAYGAQLAWSGNHVQRLDCHDDGSYQWQWGEWLAPGEVQLAQGEAIDTPDVLATFSQFGLNGVAQNFHAAVRARMTWPGGTMKPRPVHLNTWEGVYFDLEQSALMDMATGAADLGVERFVLDDGWFYGRRHDRAGLGDWWVDPVVFPDGLHTLANHVTGLGMEFGLWVEPEMVSPDSDLFRAHPDWALQLTGRPLLTGRNQLVLDLANREVFDYLLMRIGALLDNLPISYLKWDHNRELTTAGHSELPAYRGQVLALYRLMDAIRQRWPNVEIEACAGGGGRIDAGVLRYTHRVWTSDCIDAVSRVSLQRGYLQFFPPEIMGSHIGTSPAHTTGRGQAMTFRAAVALGGHLGIELDPRHLTDAHKSTVRDWVATYKSQRDTLHCDHVWQGQTKDGLYWQAQGTVDDCVVSVFRLAPSGLRYPSRLALPFVVPNARYQIKSLTPPAVETRENIHNESLLETNGLVVAGAWLAHVGVGLPPMLGEAAIILSVKKM